MKDYIELGPTPCNEDCSQVGSDGFTKANIRECRIFKKQLERAFPTATFQVKSFHHEFGTYREVVVVFDDQDETSEALALEVEGNIPVDWDNEAKRELDQREVL